MSGLTIYQGKGKYPLALCFNWMLVQVSLQIEEGFYTEESNKITLNLFSSSISKAETKQKEVVSDGYLSLPLLTGRDEYTGKDGNVVEKLPSRVELAVAKLVKAQFKPDEVFCGQIVLMDSAYCESILSGNSPTGKPMSTEMYTDISLSMVDLKLFEGTPSKVDPVNDGSNGSNNSSGRYKNYKKQSALELAEDRLKAVFTLLEREFPATALALKGEKDGGLKFEDLINAEGINAEIVKMVWILVTSHGLS